MQSDRSAFLQGWDPASLKKHYEEKIKRLHLSYDQMIKNIKPMIMDEAYNFVKQHGKEMCIKMTLEHRRVLD
jgi:hypothetical protein